MIMQGDEPAVGRLTSYVFFSLLLLESYTVHKLYTFVSNTSDLFATRLNFFTLHILRQTNSCVHPHPLSILLELLRRFSA